MDNSEPIWQEECRPGIKDLWNSQLCRNAEWTEQDNPRVHSTATKPPEAVISWHNAKRLHRQEIAKGHSDYHVKAFIHCYTDDQNFDGEREGIWRKWDFFYEVAAHYDGISGIDFSTNADFAEPIKRIQFYKMRALEHGAIQRGIPVIINARWGTPETWSYSLYDLPENEILAIGVVGSGINKLENRPMFDAGLREIIRVKKPPALVVIGSSNYPVFLDVKAADVVIHQFDGETNAFFKSRRGK